MTLDKIEIWKIIESYTSNLSDKIGWGKMDSLCDELIEYYDK